jgi:zinc protease
VSLKAQPTTSSLPLDSNVRYGKLSNGLTYYIRHNSIPEHKACFYFVQMVGSIQEEDEQSGLAHFLEHMAFNGSANFPGRKTIVSFIENNGGQFGSNINAYTSFDETIYNLSDIILTNDAVIDSCMLILHDWSGFLTLDNAEIDKERAIIKEEWRTRNNAQSRITEKLYSTFLAGCKYANRSPIGNMAIVENFAYQELKDYYRKWYRPDLQAVIIVGDFDTKLVEEKLKSVFANIPKPTNPAERIYYPVPDTKDPQIAVITDPEVTSSSVSISFKQDVMPDSVKMTDQKTYISLLQTITSQALSNRLSEISIKTESPFVSANATYGSFLNTRTKDSWTLSAIPKNGHIEECLASLLRENLRSYKFGFTKTEIERIKASLYALYENLYNNRNKQNSTAYVNRYVQGFLNNTKINSIESECILVKHFLAQIGPKEVNGYLRQVISDKKIAIAIIGPQKDSIVYPESNKVLGLIKKTNEENIQPYIEKTIPSSLIQKLPKKGKIVKVTTDSKWGTTNWILSNGIQVILKKTDFKDDQITMSGISKGGIAQFPDADIINARVINDVSGLGGLASFSNDDLSKILAGKSASASVSVSLTSQEVRGRSSIRDMETLFQIIYLQLTSPKKDEEAYSIFKTRLREQLQNAKDNPLYVMNDTVTQTMFGDNPRIRQMKPEDVEKLSYGRILEMYKTCFSNLGSLVFTFVGSIDEAKLKPLVEQYLASLPKGKRQDFLPDEDSYLIKKGHFIKNVHVEMQTPKASVFNLYSGVIPKNLKNDLTLNLLQQVLGIMFTQNVRENAGGTYGVNSNVTCYRFPAGLTKIEINYDTDTARVDQIKLIVHACLEHIATNGVPQEVMDMLINYTLKEIESAQKTDEYWTSVLQSYYLYGEDNVSDLFSLLISVSSDDIKRLVNELLKQNNKIEVVLLPK